METGDRWVLLAYRLPREPSTPRIALWRKLRRLGAAQVLDSLVALPLSDRSREQLEWLADEVIEAGGEASIWLAQPGSVAQERELRQRLADVIADEYRAIARAARAAAADGASTRRRTLGRLRRELRRIADRDYFPPPERAEAQAAVDALSAVLELAT